MKIINLIIIFFIFFINLINCQFEYDGIKIYDLTEKQTLTNYKSILNVGYYCGFYLNLLIVDERVDQSFYEATFSYSNLEVMVNGYNVLYENSTSKLYQVFIISSKIGIIESLSLQTLIDGTIQFQYPLENNLTCIEIDVDNLNITVLQNNNNFDWNAFQSFYAFIKIQGLIYPVEIEIGNPFYIEHIYSDIYKVTFSEYTGIDLIKDDLYKDWNISLFFTFDQVEPTNVYIPSFYGNNNNNNNNINQNQILNFETFPKDTSNVIQCMGERYGPLFKFTLTSPNIKRPLQFMEQNFAYPNLISSLGGDNYFQYIGYFNTMYANYISATNYTFKVQNNDKIQDFITTPLMIKDKFTGSTSFPMHIDTPTFFINGPNLLVVSINGINTAQYGLGLFHYQYAGKDIYPNAPFGFSLGNNLNFNYNVSLPFNYLTVLNDFHPTLIFQEYSNLQTQIEVYDLQMRNLTLKIQSIESLELIHLYDSFFLVKISIISPNGLFKIIIDDNIEFKSLEYLVSGTIYNGNYEFKLNFFGSYLKFVLYDNVEFSQTFYEGDYYSINPIKRIILPDLISNVNFDIYKIENFKFLKIDNPIDITNKSISNRLYFNYSNIDNVNRPIGFILLDPLSFDTVNPFLSNKIYYAKWVKEIGLFVVDFIIPANTQPGLLPWMLYFNYNVQLFSSNLPLESQYQLNVTSDNVDLYGPIFSKIQKYPGNGDLGVGWDITISDPINGFANGFIVVMGSIDNSIYNISIGSSGIQSFDYSLTIIKPGESCINQDYVITQVILYDSMGVNSTFSIQTLYPNPIKNPFINYLDDVSINSFTTTSCNSLDNTPPSISSFVVSRESIDLFQSNRIVEFNFTITDGESGIKINSQHPKIYLTSKDLTILECQTNISTITSLYTVSYYCNIELPFKGSDSGYIISIYGLLNNGGSYKGYSSDELNSLNLPWYIDVINSINNNPVPIITNTSSITIYGGDLWVFGFGFNNSQTITVEINSKQITIQTNSITCYNTALLISNLRPTNNSFTIKVENSNTWVVFPINYNLPPIVEITSSSESTSSSSSSSSSGSEIEDQCSILNCGNSSQGYCNGYSYICYNPWSGKDCTQKQIVISPPTINTTDPTSNIPTLDNNNILYNSLISIVSLRELDFNGKSIKSFTFDNKWLLTELGKNKNQYYTNITTSSLSTPNLMVTTNITVTLEWFTELTSVIFAKKNLTMNPFSVKYTIEISKYAFSGQLNQLELVMSALFESSKTKDVCASQEFISENENDYLKIQIQDHSLNGRFIKRAYIDSKVATVSNVLLDSSMNKIEQSNEISPNQVQSFVGIIIPIYSFKALIDPDFSVLLDSNENTNENNSNSVCTSDSSGLSNSQLAGIIIGSFGFASVIAVSIAYYIYKKRKNQKFIKNVQSKLKPMN
ncbi:hypothetical protein ACTFIW_006384 [Dictyostelium discoideum]